MDVDAEGNPTKPKMSKLTVTGDRSQLLGEADLNLCEYAENEFKIIKLPLKNCADPDGFIEVGIKGSPTKEKKSTADPAPSTPKQSNQNSEENKEQMIRAL